MAAKVAPELLKDVCGEHNLTHVKTEEKNPLPSAEGKTLGQARIMSLRARLSNTHVNTGYIFKHVILCTPM